MMECVHNQLAIDYNCAPEDFQKEGFIFTEAKQNKGRRPWPWIMPRLEMITMGNSLIINTSTDILPMVRQRLEGKTKYEAMNMPFVYGVNPYYLPDLDKITLLSKNTNFHYAIIEKDEIENLYESRGIKEITTLDMVAVITKHNDEIAGIASATIECEKMCQINVEVLPLYRGNKLATTMVNIITFEMLDRKYIPYYSTDCSNIISQRVAIQAGYIPAWSHCFRTRIDELLNT